MSREIRAPMTSTTKTATVTTACVLDCPDACSLDVVVRDGEIESIGAGSGNPVTNDFICSKVRRFGERVYHADRVLHPMKRVGNKGEGRFTRIGWDEALSTIAGRLLRVRDEFGGEAILPYDYGGSNGFLTDELLDSVFFSELGASRLLKTICAAPTTEVARDMYGKMAGVAFEDYPEAELIVIWGANPKASNIHLVPYLKEARRRGACLVQIDPIRQLPADLVDLHLPVYPGADLPLALGLIHEWRRRGALDESFLSAHAKNLEPLLGAADGWPLDAAAAEAGVRVEDLRALVERYERASPALLRCGWGLERNRNGGHAVAAILAIPALLGKFGVRGGGYTLSNGGAGRLVASELWDESAWRTRGINMTELARVLDPGAGLDPPVKALFVFNANPAVTVPDQNGIVRGLSREDLFTVVHDQVMTDTARFADVLLPATTFLEHHDLKRSYGSYVVGATRPAIAPRGEARPNLSVFRDLGRAMGLGHGLFDVSDDEIRERVVGAVEVAGERLPPEALRPGRSHAYGFRGRSPVPFETVFPGTKDGLVDLAPACLGGWPYRYHPARTAGGGAHPLALLSPASSKTINSTLGEFNLQELVVSLHPADASARGIGTGDRVRVFNDLGEVRCRARVNERLREGVVHLPKGAWMKSSLNGRTSTALTPAHVNEVGGGACFNDARVEIERLV